MLYLIRTPYITDDKNTDEKAQISTVSASYSIITDPFEVDLELSGPDHPEAMGWKVRYAIMARPKTISGLQQLQDIIAKYWKGRLEERSTWMPWQGPAVPNYVHQVSASSTALIEPAC